MRRTDSNIQVDRNLELVERCIYLLETQLDKLGERLLSLILDYPCLPFVPSDVEHFFHVSVGHVYVDFGEMSSAHFLGYLFF